MKKLIIFLVFWMVAFNLSADDLTFKPGDGHVSFYNYHTGETLNVAYRKNGKYDESALKKINHIFRSRSDNKEIEIDTALIELLDNIQDHFEAEVIELISGYRSPALNRALRRHGVNIAEESMHLEGRAADIHFNEITEEAVADYARGLKAGGVGYYPAWDFVHVDTGEIRKWDLPDKPGRLLMAFRKGSEWQILTDKDVYLKNEPIEMELINITRIPQKFADKLIIEKEYCGKWIRVKELESCRGQTLSSGDRCTDNVRTAFDGFGKYRIVIRGPKEHPYFETRSNEFYIKKM